MTTKEKSALGIAIVVALWILAALYLAVRLDMIERGLGL